MRRALPALAMTAAGIIVLLRFQSSPETGGATASPTPTTAGAATTTLDQGGFGGPGGFDPGGDDGGFGNEVPTTTVDPNAATASGATDGTYTGTEVQTRFGPVQVQATISGGKLTDVTELEAPNDRERSVQINEQAGPLLRSEALSAQSAVLDQVSGATITWAAYEQSLQAALDAAHR